MKISKYIHSCLLLEHEKQQLLFDPGKFTFIEGLVSAETFAQVNLILITHDHPDHLDSEALKLIVRLSKAEVICNSEVASKLEVKNIPVTILEEGIITRGNFIIQAIPVLHELVLEVKIPKVTGFLINNQILNPADSFSDSLYTFQNIELLILPIMAPFLTEITVFNFAKRMQPKQVLPVHDGYAKDFFIKQRYQTYDTWLKKLGIHFHKVYKPGDYVSL